MPEDLHDPGLLDRAFQRTHSGLRGSSQGAAETEDLDPDMEMAPAIVPGRFSAEPTRRLQVTTAYGIDADTLSGLIGVRRRK